MERTLLQNIPLFAKLPPEHIDELAGMLKEHSFKPSDTIFWVGDKGNNFYIIQMGRVMLTCPDERGKEITLAELGAGQFFGELSLLDGGPRTATARASTDTILLSLDRPAFMDFLNQRPMAAGYIVSVLGARQRETLDKLRGIVNVNEVVEDRMTFGQKVADGFASLMGSWTFIIVQSVILAFWVTINALALFGKVHWDEYPFVFLNLALSFQAAYAAPIIMMSQNRQGEKDRIKADLDYQVNLKAQHEIMQLHDKLDRLRDGLADRQVIPASSAGSDGARAAELSLQK
jgi:uncharacterized membrane protein